MQEVMESLDKHFGVFIILAGTSFVVLLTLIKSIAGVATSVSRERTRREVAAYIAEGSMTPEQGEKLLRAPINGKDTSVC
jgi:hypothetical protein